MVRVKLVLAAGLLVAAAVSAAWAWGVFRPDVAPADPTPTPRPIGQMVYLPGGTFRMGNDLSNDPSERPAHEVSVRAFYLDEHEVTNGQFARFVARTGYRTTAEQRGWSNVFDHQRQQWVKRQGADWRHPGGPQTSLTGRDDFPVVHVSWHDAMAHATWAGKQLPTEAQWEYAARSGLRDADYPWGRDELIDLCYGANYYQHGKAPAADGFERLAPVKSYPASRFGLYDVSGNVCEWCSDWYDADYYWSSPLQNPAGVSQQEYRVHRGGSYLSPQARRFDHQVHARARRHPEQTTSHIGFRCVRSVRTRLR